MIFKIVTLFPDYFSSPLKSGLLGKAIAGRAIKVEITDIRNFATDRHRSCDDAPYGGGSGMVLMPGPLSRAVESATADGTPVAVTSPAGALLTQRLVKELAGRGGLCIVCGRYEGIDRRFIDRYAEYEISVGDYVLSGGEAAALIIMDAVSRYAPGFMSNAASLTEESFEDDLLEYPHYTRPEEFEGMRVPEVLLSGDHAAIAQWRLEQRLMTTRRVRPDLYRAYLERKLRGE